MWKISLSNWWNGSCGIWSDEVFNDLVHSVEVLLVFFLLWWASEDGPRLIDQTKTFRTFNAAMKWPRCISRPTAMPSSIFEHQCDYSSWTGIDRIHFIFLSSNCCRNVVLCVSPIPILKARTKQRKTTTTAKPANEASFNSRFLCA